MNKGKHNLMSITSDGRLLLLREVDKQLGLTKRLNYVFLKICTGITCNFRRNIQLGAHASARLYTLVESAKANRIEPSAYLEYIFKELPNCESVEDYEALLPWRLIDRLPEYNIEHP